MESEDDFDMHDANNESAEEDDFYSGDEAVGGAVYAFDSEDAENDDDNDYGFIDNDTDDSDDVASHRQVFFMFY